MLGFAPERERLSTNTGLVLALVIGLGLAGCGSSSNSASDGVAPLSDAAVAGAEATALADAGNASEAGASTDAPIVAVEVGGEAATSPADGSVDMAATPLDGATPTDSLLVTPDAVAAEAVVRVDVAEALNRPDAVGFEAAKPADAVAGDMAASDLAPATLGEISPQQLHSELATNKDFLLIDVHTPNAGSIPGTDARIAYTDTAGLVKFIGPNVDTKVVLTCLMGGMSKQAGNALVALGYRNISELTGGMSAWTAAGYSLVHLDAGT
jgi:phage shock protein E